MISVWAPTKCAEFFKDPLNRIYDKKLEAGHKNFVSALGPVSLLILGSYSKALRCTFFGELKSSCSSKLCIIRLWYVIQGSRIKNPCCWRSVLYSRCSCISSTYSVQKRAKTCISSTYLPKNVHLKASFTKKRAKTCKSVHLKCFRTPLKKVHCQGPCILRPWISRPYCSPKIENIF